MTTGRSPFQGRVGPPGAPVLFLNWGRMIVTLAFSSNRPQSKFVTGQVHCRFSFFQSGLHGIWGKQSLCHCLYLRLYPSNVR